MVSEHELTGGLRFEYLVYLILHMRESVKDMIFMLNQNPTILNF